MTVLSQDIVLGVPIGWESGDNPVIGYDNRIEFGSIIADSSLPFFPASNLANPATNQRWRSATTDPQAITFLIDGAGGIDYIGIARHNLGSGGVEIAIDVMVPDSPEFLFQPGDEGIWPGGFDPLRQDDMWQEVFAGVILDGDGPAILQFPLTATSQVRIRLTPQSVAPEIAVVYIGKLLVLDRGLRPGLVPPTFAYQDTVVTGQAESGDFMGRIITSESLVTNVTIENISYDWWHEHMADFAKAARGQPFFFAWLPQSYPKEVVYAWTSDDIRPVADRQFCGVVVTVDIAMRALAR